jgi:protoheme IX farnesyltransferase
MMEDSIQWAKFGDYLSLTKPRTLLLHIPVVMATAVLAAGTIPLNSVLASVIFGGGLLAGSANTMNCYFDRELDATMNRTKNRALPSGRLSPVNALWFGILLGIFGLILLVSFAGSVAAALAFIGFLVYVVLYTKWLKKQTYFSSIFGSLAGAMPPIVTWVALTGSLTPTPLFLGAIITLWTPPHYWSLALYRQKEYERSGIFALPERNITIWIVSFCSLLTIASIFAGWFLNLGWLYFIAALSSGGFFTYLALQATQSKVRKLQRVAFMYSIIYLVTIFAVMLIDRLVIN